SVGGRRHLQNRAPDRLSGGADFSSGGTKSSRNGVGSFGGGPASRHRRCAPKCAGGLVFPDRVTFEWRFLVRCGFGGFGALSSSSRRRCEHGLGPRGGLGPFWNCCSPARRKS